VVQAAKFVTDFADGGVVIPLCVAVAATLALLGRTRVAFVWTTVTAGVWATMLVLKLVGYTCEHLAPDVALIQLGLITPSGHVAAAATAYGGMIGLVFGSARRASLAAFGIAVLIGLTRIALGDHTLAEVVVGGIVGVVGAGVFTSWARSRLAGRPLAALLSVTAIVMLVFHGSHLTWEPTIRATSAQAVRDLNPP